MKNLHFYVVLNSVFYTKKEIVGIVKLINKDL